MNFEINGRIMDPFVQKLDSLKFQILTLTSAATIALNVSISIAVLVFILNIVNLMYDYKTRILEA